MSKISVAIEEMNEIVSRNAVAEAWASIDGKLEKYHLDRDTPGGLEEDGVPLGYYQGYQSDAKELIARIDARGFKLVPK